MLIAQPSAGSMTAQSQPARAIDATVYQNTTGKAMHVVVNMTTTSLGNAIAAVGPTSSPATNVDRANFEASGEYRTVTFIVIPDYYYKVTRSTSNITLVTWTETY